MAAVFDGTISGWATEPIPDLGANQALGNLEPIGTQDLLSFSGVQFLAPANIEVLLRSDVQAVTVNAESSEIDGSYHVTDGGNFLRTVGSSFKGAGSGTQSTFSVTGKTNNIFKSSVTEYADIPQVSSSRNILGVTAGGLTISQQSPHTQTVLGIKSDVVIGDITEDIHVTTTTEKVYGSLSEASYRGTATLLSKFTVFDLFFGMRSEYVELMQLNVNVASLTMHWILHVLQAVGGASGVMNFKLEGISDRLDMIHGKVIGLRAFAAAKSGRAAPIVVGVMHFFGL